MNKHPLPSNAVVSYVATPAGYVAWATTPRGVCAIVLPRPTRDSALTALGAASGRADESDLGARLTAFYGGESPEFGDVPLDLVGETRFQADVRRIVRSIPRGQTLTYGEVAREAGRPGAARAVGQVMATNPVPPLVPCHRVVATTGLGGFGGGLDLKRRLLQLEGCPCEVS